MYALNNANKSLVKLEVAIYNHGKLIPNLTMSLLGAIASQKKLIHFKAQIHVACQTQTQLAELLLRLGEVGVALP